MINEKRQICVRIFISENPVYATVGMASVNYNDYKTFWLNNDFRYSYCIIVVKVIIVFHVKGTFVPLLAPLRKGQEGCLPPSPASLDVWPMAPGKYSVY